MTYVDYETQQRYPKESAKFYTQVCYIASLLSPSKRSNFPRYDSLSGSGSMLRRNSPIYAKESCLVMQRPYKRLSADSCTRTVYGCETHAIIIRDHTIAARLLSEHPSMPVIVMVSHS